ncbi:MAG: hypothetical protein KGN36_11520 [Acidobacteriota bacterium]|nr:hypothetical protein [Acidobacteriota bacterium]
MPTSHEFLRGVLALIGVACAYMAGRTLVAVRRGWQKLSRLYGWLLRSAVCLAAIVFRFPVDAMAFLAWSLAALLFALGYLQALRHKPPEDLSANIFPHES